MDNNNYSNQNFGDNSYNNNAYEGEQNTANSYNSTGSNPAGNYGNTGGANSGMNSGTYQQYGNPYQQYQTSYANTSVPKKKKKGFAATLGKAVAVAVAFGLVAGVIFTGVSYAGSKALGISSESGKSNGSSAKINTNVAQTSTGSANELTDVSAIAEEVMPSIVAITNMGTVTYQSFFGLQSYQSESAGSGIIISQDEKYLYICTNNHVVQGAETLTVQFVDDTTVSCEVTGTDPADDLAVVQVELSSIEEETLKTIKVATVGDSEKVSVGEPAIAIGNALGYGQSVTTGIVSALGRTVSTSDETTGETITNTNLIQTDAAINPGNSGGALLNQNGEVIGINSVKYSDTAVEGIGYAIPMADAVPIIEKLIAHEDIPQSAYLGIMGQNVSSDVASVYGVPEGVVITQVLEGTAAERAGLQKGDIITNINGTAVSSMTELKTSLAGYKEGDKITLTIARIGNGGYDQKEVEVTLSGQSSSSQN